MNERHQDMILGIIITCCIIACILIPRFCCRVSEEEYKKFMENYYKNNPQARKPNATTTKAENLSKKNN